MIHYGKLNKDNNYIRSDEYKPIKDEKGNFVFQLDDDWAPFRTKQILTKDLPKINQDIGNLQTTKADKSELSNYATKTDLNNKTERPLFEAMLQNYATKSELNNHQVDLSNYATKSDLDHKADRSDLSYYATKNELNNKADRSELGNYATKDELNSHQPDLSNYATKSDLDNKADRSDLSYYATKNELNNKADRSELGNYATKDELNSHQPDLSNYATKSDLDNKADRSDFSYYATKNELDNKADKSELSNYATKYSFNDHVNTENEWRNSFQEQLEELKKKSLAKKTIRPGEMILGEKQSDGSYICDMSRYKDWESRNYRLVVSPKDSLYLYESDKVVPASTTAQEAGALSRRVGISIKDEKTMKLQEYSWSSQLCDFYLMSC